MLKARFSPVPGLLVTGLEGVLAQHLVPEQMRKSGVIDELLSIPSCSLSLRWPPASFQDCGSPTWESSSYQTEGGEDGGEDGSGAISFPLQTLLCTSARGSLLERMTLLFYGVTQRLALFISSFFLLHKHVN